jgi:hypothetical protein
MPSITSISLFPTSSVRSLVCDRFSADIWTIGHSDDQSEQRPTTQSSRRDTEPARQRGSEATLLLWECIATFALTFFSSPSIFFSPLWLRYSSSRLTRSSRFSSFVIRFDWSERILREEKVERFCEACQWATISLNTSSNPQHISTSYTSQQSHRGEIKWPRIHSTSARRHTLPTSSARILFFPNHSSSNSVNFSRFSMTCRNRQRKSQRSVPRTGVPASRLRSHNRGCPSSIQISDLLVWQEDGSSDRSIEQSII